MHLQGQQQQKGKLSLPYNLSVIIAIARCHLP